MVRRSLIKSITSATRNSSTNHANTAAETINMEESIVLRTEVSVRNMVDGTIGKSYARLVNIHVLNTSRAADRHLEERTREIDRNLNSDTNHRPARHRYTISTTDRDSKVDLND